MAVQVVVGAQWGDEGKGKLVDILSERVDIVARYQGGANAGHTVEFGDRKFILHLIPSGIFHEHVTVVIGNGVVIDPEALMTEIRMLESSGISLKNRLKISHNAHLIMPYHKLLDSLSEVHSGLPIGTTGRGIGPAYYDKAARTGIRIVDLLDHKTLEEALRRNIKEKNAIIKNVFEREELDVEAILEQYLTFDRHIDEYIADVPHFLNHSIHEGRNVLCEGAQGALLDIDHGTYPFVTSSSPTSGGACTGLGIPPTSITSVMGVAKAYCTRVGNGPFPSEEVSSVGDDIRTKGFEYGSTTQRPRRCGWFDVVSMKHSAMINGITECGIMKLDVLSGFDEIKVCTAYEVEGKKMKSFPTDVRTLDRVTPVYETFHGWKEDISTIRSFDELPKNARNYIKALSYMMGIRINYISVGPKRNQTIAIPSNIEW